MKVREVHLYSEKIKQEDVRNLFNQVVRARLPLFGFLDFSSFFSPNFLKLIVNRQNNTMRFYVKDKKNMQSLSALVFPYRFSEALDFTELKGKFSIPPRFYILGGSHDFLDFMLKESITELHMYTSRILGLTFGVGTATDEHGKKSLILVPNPPKFFVIDLEKNPAVYIELLEPIPKKMSTTSRYPIFEDTGMTLGPDNFDAYQHSIIVGASGTGKSKGMYVMLRAIEELHKDNVRMLILDPHGEFAKMMPGKKVVNFVDNYVEPLEMGGQKTPLLTQLIAQLIASSIGQENKYSERVLFYSVHLLTEIDKLTLTNISMLLTDSAARAEFVGGCENDEVKRFFDEEFNDIYLHHFNDAVLPILNFVGEYQLYLGKTMKKESLIDVLRKNRVVILSFDPHFFGITGQLQDKPTILAIDEFPRVENKVAKDILIETRKYNLYLYLSAQYLNQLSKEVYDSIIGNVRNIVAFKLARQDATSISSIMEIKIEEFFKKNRTQTELEESKKEMFVRLHQRECIVRLFDGKTYLLPMKLRVVDTSKYGYTETVHREVEDPDRAGMGDSAQYAPSQTTSVAPETRAHRGGMAQVEPEPEKKNVAAAKPRAPMDDFHKSETGLMYEKEEKEPAQEPEEEEHASEPEEEEEKGEKKSKSFKYEIKHSFEPEEKEETAEEKELDREEEPEAPAEEEEPEEKSPVLKKMKELRIGKYAKQGAAPVSISKSKASAAASKKPAAKTKGKAKKR
ncbi:MAG: DUF87 domain-containing protein [Candidatus Micrarchaeota archaeon]|nr:DUF87 domain-containing protein [Candidatus Micrarchaeota archaeon]